MRAGVTLCIVEAAEELARRVADFFVASAGEAVKKRGAFFAALSGGSTPRAAHRLLGQPPYQDAIDWSRIHLFWVDDRCVPYTDAASNFGAARSDFISKVPLPDRQVHPMPTTIPPEAGACKYDEELKAVPVSPSGFPQFDTIFLGMGPDGHTASLFPRQQALEEKDRWVLAVKGGDPDLDRLTLTLPVLNGARHVAFMVSGPGKASVVRAVLDDRRNDLPAARIAPAEGRLTWFLDGKAASMLVDTQRYERC